MILRNSVTVKAVCSSVAKKIGYILAVGIIASAILITTAHLLTPILNHHRNKFEKWASHLLRTPVVIQKVAVSWYHYQPVISLKSVTILNKQTQEPVLEIEKLMVFFSLPKSLWQQKLVPSSIVVTGTDIHLHKSPAGEIFVQGFPVLGGFNQEPYKQETKITDVLALLSTQPNLILRDIDIRYSDANGKKRYVTLYNLNVQNYSTQHSIIGSAILHQQIPTEATLAIRWTGTQPDLASIKAKMYLYVSGVSLSQWLKNSTWNQWQMTKGIGSAKIWATWQHGSFRKIQSIFQIYGLNLYSKTNQTNHKINRFSGHLGWQRDGANQIFAGNDLLIDLPNHLWPVNNFYISLTPDAKGDLSPKMVNIGYLDLHDIQSYLSSFVFIPAEKLQLLSKLQLKGELQNTMITFGTKWDDWPHIDFATDFNRIGFSSWNKFPSVSNLSGNIKWHNNQGDLSLNSRQIQFLYDSIFANPIQLDQLSAAIHGEIAANNEWVLRASSLHVQNNDITADASGTVTLPTGAPPVTDINATFNLHHANQVTHYLPLHAFNASLVEWLKQAFLTGEVKNGHALLRGSLHDFPFAQEKGMFLIEGDVNDIDLKYAPTWPTLQHITGKLIFAGRKMTVDLDHGQILDVPITHVHAEISDLSQSALQVNSGDIPMNFTQGIDFLHASPLENTIGKLFKNIALDGPISLKLGLTIPLHQADQTKVRGSIAIKNAVMNLIPWHLKIENLNGALTFTENKIDAKNLQGQSLNEPVTLSLATIKKDKDLSIVRAKLLSRVAIVDLEKWLKMPLSTHIKGATDLKSEIDFSYKTPVFVHLKSNLVGITIEDPKEFAKTAQEARPFTADILIPEQKPLRVKLNYGGLASAALLLERKKAEFNLRSVHLQLGKGDPNWLEESGLFISGNFKKLSWDKIKDYYAQTSGGQFSNLPLRGLNINADSLELANLRFDHVRLEVTPSEDDWDIEIMSPDVRGKLQIPKNFTRQEMVNAQFQKLNLRTKENSPSTLPAIDVKSLPAIRFIADNVKYNSIPLDEVEFRAIPSEDGLHIERLRMVSSRIDLKASGDWTTNSTHLRGSAFSSRVSELISSFGFNAHNFISSEGNILFDLNWPSAMYSPSIANLNGNARLELKSGRIVDVGEESQTKMDLGRMLSIFSLQTIPRRLSLDFSDLFQKGYSFDSVRGDFALKNGDAFTENLRFDGPVAGVGLFGRIGLKQKDYDFTLSVSVSPYVSSAPSLPVAGYLAVLTGPVGGLAALAVGTMVGSAVSKATTYYYAVKGPWSKPVWNPVDSRG